MLRVQEKLINFFVIFRLYSHEIILFLILCAALLLRLYTFHDAHYSYMGDYNRDYLVAHHIITYREFPLAGPDGELGAASNSPAYFYLLTIPLLIKDDIIFLGLFNVFLQISSLILVYLIARAMFGKRTGLIAAALFGLSQTIIDQSKFVWQPHIMQPFLLLSLFLLYLGYARKNYGLMIGSVCVFLFSAVLHQSVFAFTPGYLFIIFLILRSHQKPFVFYAGIISIFLGALVLLHVPLFFYFTKHADSFVSFSHSSRAFITVSFGQLLYNTSSRLKIFLDFFFAHENSLPMPAPLFGIFFAIASVLCLWFGKQTKKQRTLILILLMSLVQFFVLVVAVSESPLIPFPFWYFTPLFGMFIICISEIMFSLIPRSSFSWVIELLAVSILLFAFSPNLLEHMADAMRRSTQSPKDFFMPSYHPPYVIAGVEHEIIRIQSLEHRKNPYFFDIRTFRFGREDPYSNEIFWVPLERDLGIPLVRLDESRLRSYRPIGNADYVFINCITSDVERECLTPFAMQFPYYRIKKALDMDPSLYVAEKTNLR